MGRHSIRKATLPPLPLYRGKNKISKVRFQRCLGGGAQNPRYRGIGRDSRLLPDASPLAVGRVYWNPKKVTPATAVTMI